jgi:hypothetical protein
MWNRLKWVAAFCLAGSVAAISAQNASVQADPPAQSSAVTTTQAPHLIESGTYTNSAGDQIHRPAHTDTGKPPAGASAQCGDLSYSFSASRRGTCSHHGGVARWL